MLNLRLLNTSLTKHGAHKIAQLIVEHDPDNVISKLSGQVPGINIEEAQARKNLSAYSDGKLPQVWKDAKAQGSEAINALVLVAIIFSHHALIEAMRKGATGGFSGTIKRGDILDGKAYTNFAHIIDQLGYSTRHDRDYVNFDLVKLFNITGLNKLVLQLLEIKMKAAGWDGGSDLQQLLLDNDFNEVFATDKTTFSNWLADSDEDAGKVTAPLEDAEYFVGKDYGGSDGKYTFEPGHKEKKTGSVTVKTPISAKTATLLHNHIQNIFYEQLATKYGRSSVGCEVPTGMGTSIDVVVDADKFRWFYEIKVAETIKACIRQAIPQLLEYAYWACDEVRVDKLIIVSTHALDKRSDAYLRKLRDDFGLPLYYERFTE